MPNLFGHLTLKATAIAYGMLKQVQHDFSFL